MRALFGCWCCLPHTRSMQIMHTDGGVLNYGTIYAVVAANGTRIKDPKKAKHRE